MPVTTCHDHKQKSKKIFSVENDDEGFQDFTRKDIVAATENIN